jgi:hypothetical protein
MSNKIAKELFDVDQQSEEQKEVKIDKYTLKNLEDYHNFSKVKPYSTAKILIPKTFPINIR